MRYTHFSPNQNLLELAQQYPYFQIQFKDYTETLPMAFLDDYGPCNCDA